MAPSRGSTSSSARRVADLLSAFLNGHPDLGVSELSRQLGWPKSVVHRVLITLEQSGFVASDPVSRRYRLGPKALRLGLAALAQTDIRRLALPRLRSLRDRTGETTTLSLLSGDERVYVEQVESLHPVRQTIPIGGRAPLYVGASSKAILAFLPIDRQERILAMAVGARRVDGTPIDPALLRDEIQTIRQQGYAISRSERILGATSVAAPIFDHRGEVIGSMSVAGVTVRQNQADLEALGPLVRETAAGLSIELGWSGTLLAPTAFASP